MEFQLILIIKKTCWAVPVLFSSPLNFKPNHKILLLPNQPCSNQIYHVYLSHYVGFYLRLYLYLLFDVEGLKLRIWSLDYAYQTILCGPLTQFTKWQRPKRRIFVLKIMLDLIETLNSSDIDLQLFKAPNMILEFYAVNQMKNIRDSRSRTHKWFSIDTSELFFKSNNYT